MKFIGVRVEFLCKFSVCCLMVADVVSELIKAWMAMMRSDSFGFEIDAVSARQCDKDSDSQALCLRDISRFLFQRSDGGGTP